MEERRSVKCPVINTLASTAESSYLQTTMCAHSVEKSTQLDLYDVQNAGTRLKWDKSNVATVACRFR